MEEILKKLGLPPLKDIPSCAPVNERFEGWTLEQLDTFIAYCEEHEDEIPLER